MRLKELDTNILFPSTCIITDHLSSKELNSPQFDLQIAPQTDTEAHPDNAVNINQAQQQDTPEQPGNDMPPPSTVTAEKKSLLVQAAAARKGKPEETENERLIQEEQELLRNITRQKALKGVNELAKVDSYSI